MSAYLDPPSPQTVTHRPRELTTACSCRLEVEDGTAGPIVVVYAAGEIDRTTVPTVRTALAAAVGHRPHDLVVDLAGVGFCCLHGLALFVEAGQEARAAGIGFGLAGLHPRLDWVVARLWPDEHLVRYRSTAAAVTAVRIDQTYRNP